MSPLEVFDATKRRRTPVDPDTVLPGDHDTMAAPARRSHYNAGCRHADCVQARKDYEADYAERKGRGEVRTYKRRIPGQQPPAAPQPAPEPDRRSGVRVSTIGATRRIQGLMRVGHSPVAIALASQVGVDAVWWLALGKLDTVDEVTHRVIDKAFRRLRQELPEPRVKTAASAEQLTALCRELAAEHGWAGPFDWDDIDTDSAPKHGYGRGAHAGLVR